MGCLGIALEAREKRNEGKIRKECTETFWDGGYVHYLNCGDDFMGVLMSKLIKLCTLNTLSLLNDNYTSAKSLKTRQDNR